MSRRRCNSPTTVHQHQDCTCTHDRQDCTNRCALIMYAWPERSSTPPIAPSDRPSHTHSRASPSVLPQITPHRRDIQPTSWWRAEHRGYHHERLQGTRRDRGRASARAAARAVAVVMTTVASEVHVEHVGAAGRRPARDCAALRVAETLQGSSPGPGPLIQSTGAAGEPLQRTRKTAVQSVTGIKKTRH